MKKRYYVVVLATVAVILSIVLYYCSLINLCGNIKIVVLNQDQVSLDSAKVFGVGGLNSKTMLNLESNAFVASDSHFFKGLEIDFTKHNSTTPIRLKVFDKSNLLICDTVLVAGKVHRLSSFKTNVSFLEKSIFIIITILTNKVMLVLYFVVLIIGIFYLLYRRINRYSFMLLCISFVFAIIPIIQLAYYFEFRMSSGFFAMCSAFLFIVAIFVRNNMSPKRKNFVLVLSSSFFSIFLVELILRISGLLSTDFEKRFGYYESVSEQNEIRPFWTHKEYYDYTLANSEFSFVRESNSLGLSDDESKLYESSDHQLILALGDSFTEGDGAHADSTWLKFLEHQFINDSIFNLCFFNAGVCGSDPVYEYKLLDKKLLEFNPDIVVVSFGNELTDLICRGGKERFKAMKPALKGHWWETIYSASHLFRLIVHKFFGYNDLLISQKDYNQQKIKALDDLKIAIDDFDKLAKRKGFKLVIVFYPLKDEVINKTYDYNQELLDYANDKGIICVDLLNYYVSNGINSSNIHNYYWEQDGHHKAAGYEVYAEGVYPKIKALINQPL